MPLADIDDINQHLPSDRIALTDNTDEQLQIDAERVVKGYLSNVYSATTLASWNTPDETPGLIRSIAGRLIAAWFYANRVSGDVPQFAEYAKQKYDEAIKYLEQIRSGDITLTEVAEEVTVGERFTTEDFYPNDIDDPAPFFSVGQTFA